MGLRAHEDARTSSIFDIHTVNAHAVFCCMGVCRFKYRGARRARLCESPEPGQRSGVPLFPHACFSRMYASIALAACLPAPMARMTVAAPVTASPPA